MSRIFISHNSQDAQEAVALKQWLAEGGWDEVFLDIDARDGLSPGERWKEALRVAADRCEAILCLVSPTWLASAECKLELRYAETLRKAIFLAIIKPCEQGSLPPDWQWCPLFGDGAQTSIRFKFRDQDAECAFLTDGLDRLKVGLQKAGINPESFPWPPFNEPDRAPYRGLKPLEAVDAAVFFGREADILRGMEKLREMRQTKTGRLLVILGASGSGKSSFMRAGLLPRLARDDKRFFCLPVIRPRNKVLFGDDGLAPALAAASSALGTTRTRGKIEEWLRGGPEAMDSLLERLVLEVSEKYTSATEADPPSLIIPIDQGEELFNPDGASEAAIFLALLGRFLAAQSDAPALLDRTHGQVIAVLTIRSDRYERLQSAPEFAAVAPHLLDLRPFPVGQFERVINGPAERSTKGNPPRLLRVESALCDRLLMDFAQGADTLPLLGFALEKLFHKYGGDGDMTLAEYEAIRGSHETVQAAIFQEAVDNAFAEPFRPPAIPLVRTAQYQMLRDAFIPDLVRINPETGEPMRQVASFSRFPADVHPLIERLIEARLLVRDKDDVEVAHESLLRQWPVLSGWLTEEKDNLRTLEKIRSAAADWNAASDEKKEKLREELLAHRGELLVEAEKLLATPVYMGAAGQEERAYLLVCREAQDERVAAAKEEQDRRVRDAERIAEEQSKALRAQKNISRRTRIGLILVTVAAVIAGEQYLETRKLQLRADDQARAVTSQKLALEMTNARLERRLALRAAPYGNIPYDVPAGWFQIGTTYAGSVAFVEQITDSKNTITGTGVIVNAKQLHPTWKEVPVFVTAALRVNRSNFQSASPLENTTLLFIGPKGEHQTVRLGTVLWQSTKVFSVQVWSIEEKLPIGAIMIERFVDRSAALGGHSRISFDDINRMFDDRGMLKKTEYQRPVIFVGYLAGRSELTLTISHLFGEFSKSSYASAESDLVYTYSTAPGSAGGPIFDAETGYLIGIHLQAIPCVKPSGLRPHCAGGGISMWRILDEIKANPTGQ